MGSVATEPLSTGYGPRGVLEFRILGPLEVVREHCPLRLGGPKQRATLAILLLNANRVVSVDRLADDLYSGAAPVTAVTQVQRQVSELRKGLGAESVIETRSPGYLIRLLPEQLDLHRFERLAEEATRSEALLAANLLREALDLYRKTRERLVEEFGIEPTVALRELERAILAQDRSLDLADISAVEPNRTVLVLPRDDDRLEGVLAMAKSFAAASDRELIVARLVANETQLR